MTKEHQSFMHKENRDSSPFGEPLNFFDFAVQDEFQELFNDETLLVPPHWFRNHASCFYTTESIEPRLLAGVGKIAPNCSDKARARLYDIFRHERNFEIQNGMSYRDYLLQEIKKAIYEHVDNLEPKPKTKKKADFKNKAYKNTAKKTKPSPILMSLINRKI